MPKAIMVVYSEPADSDKEGAYRAWYDFHIKEAIKAVPGMSRAARYKLAVSQGHSVDEPFRYMTIYEIDSPDVDEVHRQLAQAWERGDLPKSDIIKPGPVVYWDLDSEITA